MDQLTFRMLLLLAILLQCDASHFKWSLLVNINYYIDGSDRVLNVFFTFLLLIFFKWYFSMTSDGYLLNFLMSRKFLLNFFFASKNKLLGDFITTITVYDFSRILTTIEMFCRLSEFLKLLMIIFQLFQLYTLMST